LTQMIFHDWAREDYSHSYLLPFVVLYLLWEKRAALASIPSSPSWIGIIPFVFGLSLYWLGELGGEFYTLYLSLWFVVVGLAWLHLGWRKLKATAFALFMMLTMFPFPSFINNKILVGLRLISSQLGVWMLHLYGMSAYREGNVIDLGFTQLQVVDACSGLRYMIPLAVLSLLLAHWFNAALWKKTLLVLSSLPLAIAVNSFRIAATGVLYSLWGAEVAEGFFHGFSGWLIFMFTLPVLLLEMWVLKKLGSNAGGANTVEEGIEPPAGRQQAAGTGGRRSGLLQPVFMTAVVLIATTFVISKGVDFREKIPIKQPLNEFPMSVGEWRGTRQMMEQQFIDALHFSEYFMANYRNPQGQDIDFYVAYYESQRKGETTHSPETCLPVSGWTFEQSGTAKITAGNDRSMEVNRAFMEKGGSRQLVYFWFPQRGRILTSLYQVKLYGFWDALIQHRTDGALVRIITPIYTAEKMKDAEARIQGFTREIVPMLNGFIPGKQS
ncbi:MAG: VPLPA-CTERM-specific exosortase XrtD, partial [Planctomycetota bacterium]